MNRWLLRAWCWLSTGHYDRECIGARALPTHELMTFRCRSCGTIFQEKW